MKPNRNRARDLGFYVLLIVIMMAVIFTMTGDKDTNKIKNYSDLVDLFTEEKVQSFRTEGSTIILEVRTGDAIAPTEEMKYDLYSFGVFYEDFKDIIKTQYKSGVLEQYDYDEGFVAPWWASMIPYVLVMVGVMALWYVMMNKAGGGAGGIAKFSKARTRLGSDEKNKKTFADVAGCDEEKEELEAVQYVQYMQQQLYLRGKGDLDEVLSHCGICRKEVMRRENRKCGNGRFVCVLFSCGPSQVSMLCLLTKQTTTQTMITTSIQNQRHIE